MVLGLRSRAHPGGTTVTTTTTTTRHPPKHNAQVAKPTLMQRLRGPRRTHPATTKARPVRRTRVPHATRATRTKAAPRRKTSISDKVSGAMLKLKGTLTRRPGQKAAGTRRMHGTDGRGTHRRYY